MNRRGMALLVVLWLLVILTGLAGVTLAGGRVGSAASRNRTVLLRGQWAAEGCLAVFRGRGGSARGLDSLDLGQGTWCSLVVTDPANRLHLNLAAESQLRAFVGDSVRAADIVARRPIPAVAALTGRLPPGMLAHLTVEGSGRINPNTAPAAILAALPGVGPDGAQAFLLRRGQPPLQNADEALAALPAHVRDRVLGQYDTFVAATEYASSHLLVTAEGHIGAGQPVARLAVTLVPTAGRLAVIRREVE